MSTEDVLVENCTIHSRASAIKVEPAAGWHLTDANPMNDMSAPVLHIHARCPVCGMPSLPSWSAAVTDQIANTASLPLLSMLNHSPQGFASSQPLLTASTQ